MKLAAEALDEDALRWFDFLRKFLKMNRYVNRFVSFIARNQTFPERLSLWRLFHEQTGVEQRKLMRRRSWHLVSFIGLMTFPERLRNTKRKKRSAADCRRKKKWQRSRGSTEGRTPPRLSLDRARHARRLLRISEKMVKMRGKKKVDWKKNQRNGAVLAAEK